MDPHLYVGIDVGSTSHRVEIAQPNGSILEEFDISHTYAGFRELFRLVEQQKERLELPATVATEGFNRCARPLDRLVQAEGGGYQLTVTPNLHLMNGSEARKGSGSSLYFWPFDFALC